MKKLAICGCSFMTSSYQDWILHRGADWPKEFPMVIDNLSATIREELKKINYKHWPSFLDLYAKHKNFNIVYLSQRGCNNLDIRMQVDEAVKLSADYVIIAATDWNRGILKNKNVSKHNESLAYKMYLTELYDSDAKQINDYYILQSGLNLLEKHDIPYVFIPNLMKELDWKDYNIVWPQDKEQPWEKAFVNNTWNHVAFEDHKDLYNTLAELTENW